MMKRLSKQGTFLKKSLSAPERLVFQSIRRDLADELNGTASEMIIDLLACEYIRYNRALVKDEHRIAAQAVNNLIAIFNEMGMTPKSKQDKAASGTLSTILAVMGGKSNARTPT